MLDGFIGALRLQGDFCERLQAPLTAAVVRTAADDAEAGGPFAAAGGPWRGATREAAVDDAVALRLAGAMHALALGGRMPDLAGAYSAGAVHDAGAFSASLKAAAGREPDFIAGFMRSPPQTNEVRRSLCLVGGFLTVAHETGLPLRTLEIGASAGLNLNWDAFHYAFAGADDWGDPASPVQLEGDWRGPSPPRPALRVASRAACDLAPIDVRDPLQLQRLTAYVWPEQPDRLARLRAAAALAVAHDVRVEQADAGAWARVHVRPQAGVATVLYHSVMRQYLSPETTARLDATIASAGAAATPEAPFAYLTMEPAGRQSHEPHEVRLRTWPADEDRRLARVHPHGAIVFWEGSTPRSVA